MGAASAAPQCVGRQRGHEEGEGVPQLQGQVVPSHCMPPLQGQVVLSHPMPSLPGHVPGSHSKPWKLGGAGGDWGTPADAEDQHKDNVAQASRRGRNLRSLLHGKQRVGMQGYRDMGCRVVPARWCLRLLPCLAAPRREPLPVLGRRALSISPSAREHAGWGKPTPIMFVPLI